MGGLIGAAVATVVYEIGGALVFASSKTELPLSSVGHDPRNRLAAGRHLLGGRRGMGIQFVRAGEGFSGRHPLEAGTARPQRGSCGPCWFVALSITIGTDHLTSRKLRASPSRHHSETFPKLTK